MGTPTCTLACVAMLPYATHSTHLSQKHLACAEKAFVSDRSFDHLMKMGHKVDTRLALATCILFEHTALYPVLVH